MYSACHSGIRSVCTCLSQQKNCTLKFCQVKVIKKLRGKWHARHDKTPLFEVHFVASTTVRTLQLSTILANYSSWLKCRSIGFRGPEVPAFAIADGGERRIHQCPDCRSPQRPRDHRGLVPCGRLQHVRDRFHQRHDLCRNPVQPDLSSLALQKDWRMFSPLLFCF